MEWPFYAKKPLTNPEQVLYYRLCQALPNKMVLAQVALSRILEVKSVPNRLHWFNQISRLSLDFVICEKDSTVIAVIELDDRSHTGEARKLRDEKKERALTASGIKVIRFNVKDLPTEDQIRSAVNASIARTAGGGPPPVFPASDYGN